MKIKRVIEIDESLYNRIQERMNTLSDIPCLFGLVADSKPYNPTGDTISREALRKAIEEVEDDYDGYEPNDLGRFMCKVDDLIDNAQAVEITEEQAINKLHETGWLIGHDKEMTTRPQGEWKTVKGIDGDEYYECSNCGEPWVLMAGTPKDNNMNFCPNCGAEMRKGGTE